MKYLIILLFGFLSCTNYSTYFLVEKVTFNENNPSMCIYQIQPLKGPEFDLIDECGKYQAGDTLIFTKK